MTEKDVSMDAIIHEINFTTIAFGYFVELLVKKGVVTLQETEEVNNKAIEHYKKITDILKEDNK